MTAKGPAFITGGSSGIGLAMATQLAQSGHDLALIARRADLLDQVVRDLRRQHPDRQIHGFAADVGDSTACFDAVTRAVDLLGPPRWAIANAGIAIPGQFRDQPFDQITEQLRINALGAAGFARACLDHMTRGHMVFVGSGAAFFGIYGYAGYGASKFALRGLAESLRVELAPQIAVTLAYPPDTDTPQLVAEQRTKPAVTKAITDGGGLWQPQDVARVILRRAAKGRFTATPGLQMTALLLLHSLLGPILRRWQIGLARKHRSEKPPR